MNETCCVAITALTFECLRQGSRSHGVVRHRRRIQEAYSKLAMAERDKHLRELNVELRAKVRKSDSERALAAFAKVLSAAGVEAWDGAYAQYQLEAWDDAGFPDCDWPRSSNEEGSC